MSHTPYPSRRAAKRAFTAAYSQLSRRGACDLVGSREYQRVLAGWERDGRPVDVVTYIVLRVNRPAPHR